MYLRNSDCRQISRRPQKWSSEKRKNIQLGASCLCRSDLDESILLRGYRDPRVVGIVIWAEIELLGYSCL